MTANTNILLFHWRTKRTHPPSLPARLYLNSATQKCETNPISHPPYPEKRETNPITPPRVIPSDGLRSEVQRPKVEGPAQSASPKAIPNKQIPPHPKKTKRTQFATRPTANRQKPKARKYETNPIPVRARHAVPLQYETNPIYPHSHPAHDQKRETNPISSCRPPQKRETNPITTAADLWKTKKCETNPIYTAATPPHKKCETNPISAAADLWKTKNAKRTQFHHAARPKKRETNPIYRTAGVSPASPCPIMRNEPNLHRSHPAPQKIRNKPNLPTHIQSTIYNPLAQFPPANSQKQTANTPKNTKRTQS